MLCCPTVPPSIKATVLKFTKTSAARVVRLIFAQLQMPPAAMAAISAPSRQQHADARSEAFLAFRLRAFRFSYPRDYCAFTASRHIGWRRHGFALLLRKIRRVPHCRGDRQIHIHHAARYIRAGSDREIFRARTRTRSETTETSHHSRSVRSRRLELAISRTHVHGRPPGWHCPRFLLQFHDLVA